MDISEWSWKKQAWVPFKKDDVQLELVKMSPYQLKTMETDKKGACARGGMPCAWRLIFDLRAMLLYKKSMTHRGLVCLSFEYARRGTECALTHV